METTTSTTRTSWSKGRRYGLFIIGGIFLAVLFAFVFGYFVMLLWNWLMPAIFGLGAITYWQAFGIILLARLIFGQIGHKHNHSDHSGPSQWKSKFHSRVNCKDSHWKDWKYYDEYWKEEGKQAFDDYVQKKEKDDNE